MFSHRKSNPDSRISRHHAAMAAGKPELSPYYVAPAAELEAIMTERQEATLVDRGLIPFA